MNALRKRVRESQTWLVTSGSSRSLRGELSTLRRSLTDSLYISMAENFKKNSLSVCLTNKRKIKLDQKYYAEPFISIICAYLLYVVIYIFDSVLRNSTHGVRFPAACLPIGKNSCCTNKNTVGKKINMRFMLNKQMQRGKKVVLVRPYS